MHYIFDFIEVFYNEQRSHSTLGYVSPGEFERSASQARGLVAVAIRRPHANARARARERVTSVVSIRCS